MNHDSLRRKIRNMADAAAVPTPDCAGDHQIASWAEGSVDAESRRRWLSHIAGCDYCIARLGQVNRLRDVEFEDEVPEILLARAVRVGHAARARRARKTAHRWAAAAVVVLAVALLFGRPGSDPDGLTGAPNGPAAVSPQSRTIDPDAMRPLILAPPEGSGILAGDSLIRWQGIPGSLYYEIRLVSADGDMIWQERVASTEWRLPGHLQLVPGEDYFVRVDAYLAEAKSINSRHVKFRAGRGR